MIAKYLLDQICFISPFGSQRISSLFSTPYFYHSSGCQRCCFYLLVLIATSIFWENKVTVISVPTPLSTSFDVCLLPQASLAPGLALGLCGGFSLQAAVLFTFPRFLLLICKGHWIWGNNTSPQCSAALCPCVLCEATVYLWREAHEHVLFLQDPFISKTAKPLLPELGAWRGEITAPVEHSKVHSTTWAWDKTLSASHLFSKCSPWAPTGGHKEGRTTVWGPEA